MFGNSCNNRYLKLMQTAATNSLSIHIMWRNSSAVKVRVSRPPFMIIDVWLFLGEE